MKSARGIISRKIEPTHRGEYPARSRIELRLAATQASRQAEKDCLANGFATGSPDLARCVLAVEAAPAATRQTASSTVTRSYTPTRPTFPASLLKEQLACAEIGLNPNEEAFADCVQGLMNVLSAPLMEQLYRN